MKEDRRLTAPNTTQDPMPAVAEKFPCRSEIYFASKEELETKIACEKLAKPKEGTDTVTFDDLKASSAVEKSGSDMDCLTAPPVKPLKILTL